MSHMIYKVPGPNRGPKGTTYAWRGIEEGGKVPDGWHDSLSDAVDAALGPADKPKRTRRTKAEIEASKAENS